jgi:PKD repeat protein
MFRIGGEESRVSTNLSAAYLPASYLLNNLMFPSVAGNRVVWRDFQNRTAGDIFLNDTSAVPPRQIQVSSGTNEKSKPQISDDRIAWTETSGAVQEIHLFTVGTPQECPVVTFTKSTTGGGAPLSVRFSDSTGTVRASHWYWDFGDGSVSYEQNPVHGFAANGQYLTNLTISDDYCRIMSSSQQITVGSPVADFSANTTSGIVPLSVTFSDLSSGSPASWAWDFENDGVTDSNSQNPTRLYTTPGTYTVKLTATNAYGSSTKTRTGYISVLAGAHATATIPVNGIATDNRFGDQFLAYDSSRTGVPVLDPAHIILVSHPGGSGGWQNITFESADTIGFSNAGNGTYFGNVSQTSFQTSVVETTGFLATIGDPVFVNYRMVLPDYPAAASLVTEVWENAIAEDNTSLSTIALSGGFTGVDATGYTARYKRNSLGTIGTATINMSAGSAWVAGADGPAIGRDKTYILAIGSDPSTGNKNGMVLDLVYTCSDASLDYFEAAIPASYSYLSTFIIAKLSGTGNPFQMITLSIASRIGPTTGSDSGDVGAPAGQGQGAGKGTVSPPPQGPNAPPAFNAPPESVDPGQTASLYANTQGVVTQATTLQSTDRVATISISEGVVAMDSTGSPLSSVSVTALPAGNLPAPSSNPAHSFSGVAYELQPEGATFSPAIIISFAYPKAQWGQEYMIKSFDHKTDTWQDLQTRYDPQTGKIMAEVSHFCCFALFSTPVMPETIPVTARPTPMVTETKQVLPPPTAAVGIFLNMMAWLTDFLKNNLVLLVVAILLAVLMYAMRRKKRMDRIRYML